MSNVYDPDRTDLDVDVDVEAEEDSFDDMTIMDDEDAFGGAGAQSGTVQLQPQSIFHGSKMDYTIINQMESTGVQSKLYLCKGESDDHEYILKVYQDGKFNEERLAQILAIVQQKSNQYVSRISEHGSLIQNGQHNYYVIMDRYQALNKNAFEYLANQNRQGYSNLILTFLSQMNQALGFLHDNSIYHGDIKPENIMWNPVTKNVVLIDLGGSALAREVGKTTKVTAMTHKYAPREANGLGKINRWWDYYSLGVTTAEMLDGCNPWDKGLVQKKNGATTSIGYCFLPDQLPEYYKNMISGLIYESAEESDYKTNRWTHDRLDDWIRFMRVNDYENATNYANVLHMSQRYGGVQNGGARDLVAGNGQAGNGIPFRDTVIYEFNGKIYNINTLNELVQVFAENWNDGVQILLNNELPTEKISADVRRMIRNYVDRIQNVNPEKGETIDAAYFDFIYRFLDDKTHFYWKDFGEAKNVKEVGARLLASLRVMTKNNNKVGEWWKNAKDNTRSKATAIAEVFHGRIITKYLKTLNYDNQQTLELCAKIEDIFQPNITTLTPEEMSDLYMLSYLLMEKKNFELKDNTSFDSFSDFIKKFDEKAYSPEQAEDALNIWKEITNENEYTAEFYGWMKLNQIKANINHNVAL